MNAAPELKKDKKKKEEDPFGEEVKKEKHISKGGAKRILAAERTDNIVAQWCEQWIDNLVRTNCLPPQLKSDDFLALLNTYLPPSRTLDILSAIRSDYRRIFGNEIPDDETYEFLMNAIRADPQTLLLL
jgi:hypothetical protein